jgi:hypothetical protein
MVGVNNHSEIVEDETLRSARYDNTATTGDSEFYHAPGR